MRVLLLKLQRQALWKMCQNITQNKATYSAVERTLQDGSALQQAASSAVYTGALHVPVNRSVVSHSSNMNFSKHDGPFSLKSQAHVPSTLPRVKSPPSLGSLLMRCVSALFILLKHCHLEKAARGSKTSLPFPNISLGAKNNFVGFPFRNIEAERFHRECNWCNMCLFVWLPRCMFCP